MTKADDGLVLTMLAVLDAGFEITLRQETFHDRKQLAVEISPTDPLGVISTFIRHIVPLDEFRQMEYPVDWIETRILQGAVQLGAEL